MKARTWEEANWTWRVCALLGLLAAVGLLYFTVASYRTMGWWPPLRYDGLWPWPVYPELACAFAVSVVMAVVAGIAMLVYRPAAWLYGGIWGLWGLLVLWDIAAWGISHNLVQLFVSVRDSTGIYPHMALAALAISVPIIAQIWVAWEVVALNGTERIRHGRRRRMATLAGALAIAVVILPVLLSVAWGPQIHFDASEWDALSLQNSYGVGWSSRPGPNNARARMLDDMLNYLLIPGMTRENVEAYMGEYDAGGNGTAHYRLLHKPNLAHTIVAIARWHSLDPYLVLQYTGPWDAEVLGTARVE